MIENKSHCPKIEKKYYLNPNVVELAEDLLGKYLFTYIDGKLCGGIISETEAYAGITDKASHAYNNRRTKRTEIMYAEGGISYIYLCYGMYPLFNIVSNIEGIPHAVLLRGIIPTDGLDTMLERNPKKKKIDRNFANGPGKLTKALALTCEHNGLSLLSDTVWLEDRNIKINTNAIEITPRIGVDYAKEDALLPYRFCVKNEYLEIAQLNTTL